MRKNPLKGKPRSDAARMRRDSIPSPGPYDSLSISKPPEVENEWRLLPEIPFIKEGVNAFTTHYFQLGFIPKEQFPRQIEQRPDTTSVFLLLSILSISARFNKAFESRYGSGSRACSEFMRRCERLAIDNIYKEPTLERCQAFFLLAIAQQGSGKTNASYVSDSIHTC
jgi:hypothetical protein